MQESLERIFVNPQITLVNLFKFVKKYGENHENFVWGILFFEQIIRIVYNLGPFAMKK